MGQSLLKLLGIKTTSSFEVAIEEGDAPFVLGKNTFLGFDPITFRDVLCDAESALPREIDCITSMRD